MSTGVDAAAYDHNFCLPVPASLENERVALIPFEPSKHAPPFIDKAIHCPEIFDYTPFGPYFTVEDLVNDFIEPVRRNKGFILFAIFDKTNNESAVPLTDPPTPAIAGMIAYGNTYPENLVTEIGLVILPEFQRSHVTSNAVGLLLHHALDTPSTSKVPSPLGLRRVVWQANIHNKVSIRLAERMGFKLEGILRWERVLPPWKDAKKVGNGITLRRDDPKPDCIGRDTAFLGLCWDDWESDVRESVDRIMERRG